MSMNDSSTRTARSRLRRLSAAPALCALILTSVMVPSAARAQVTSSLSYTGTAEITYNQLQRTTAVPGSVFSWYGPAWLSPPAAASYLNTRQIEMHFAVRDDSHYRFDFQTVEPALEAGTRTVIVNGDQMWVYDTRTNTAATYPVPSLDPASTTPNPAAMLNLLLRGNDLRGRPGGGIMPGVPDPSSSVDAYIAALDALPAHAGTKGSANVVGHDTLLGRPVDVIDYGPLYEGLGWSRLWVDAQHPFLLKEEDEYGQVPAGSGDIPHDLLYRVTSINFGTGPSDSDLSPSFPVKPVAIERAPGTSSGSPSSGGTPPAPFLAIQAPDASIFQTACDPWNWGQEGPSYYGTQWVTQLFLAQHSECGAPTGAGPYVMVQQYMQVAGMPPALQIGSSTTIDGCRIWSGTYPDGQTWANLDVGQVAIQVTSNALSADQITQYAGTAVCTAHEATTDTTPPGVLLPPDTWFCVGGTARPSITLYTEDQRGEQCFHYLDQAVAVLSPSVQEIIPPGASGSINTATCAIRMTGSDPPGGVYFVRCPSAGGRGWEAGWNGFPTAGPNPIKPGDTSSKARKAKKSAHKKKHTRKPHARTATGSVLILETAP